MRLLSRSLTGTLLLLVLALAGCASPGASSSPLIIEGLFNLTGDMSAYDTPASQGVQLAIKQQNAAGGIHGRTIQYEALDTGTQPARIVSASNEAIRKAPAALIGYNDPDSVLSAGPLAQRAGIPFMTVGATSPLLPEQIGDMVFLAAFGDNVQAAFAAEYMYDKLNARRVYVLTNKGAEYTRGLSAYFQARWNELSPHSIYSDTYQMGDTDFSAQIERMKAVQPPPDAIYCAAYPDELPSLLPALRAAGFTQPIMGGDGFDGPSTAAIKSNGQPISNVFFTTHGHLPAPASGPLHDFATAFAQEYGHAPDTIFTALGYDAARVLLDALNRAQDTTGPAIRTALEATHDFAGATGTLSFGTGVAHHVPDKSVTVVEVRDGQFYPVVSSIPKSVPAPEVNQ